MINTLAEYGGAEQSRNRGLPHGAGESKEGVVNLP